MDYTIKIGGAAGQGIQTIGGSLSRVFSRAGYHIFSFQDYESRVRGGHNFFQIRFSDKQVLAPREGVDILIALDTESIPRHSGELTEVGIAVYDSASLKQKHEGKRFVDVPFKDLAVEHGGNPIMANTVASGAAMGMLGMDVSLLDSVIRDELGGKGSETVEANVRAARAGHEYAAANCPACSFQAASLGDAWMLVEGNEAIGLGAIAAGCKLYAAYPMTPSTGILSYLAGKAADHGLVVEQAEDEIAAINMAIGASYAGVRAMTGTSGGGFALMVEGLSLAGMTETPVVMVLAQRPGPATGLPTRTEQADLLYGLYAGHGEFPRVVLAPGSPEQAFYLVTKAFDLAEKYQVPVVILSDQHYADSVWTVDRFELESVPYHDYRVRGEALERFTDYRRHAFTETGISPFAVPGESKHLVVTDSDEHDEEGHIIEDAETRAKMVEKRMTKKWPGLVHEMSPPHHYGSKEPRVVLVGWGSTYGVMREAVDALGSSVEIAMLHFSEIHPLASAGGNGYLDVITKARLAVCIENNITGRFARYFRGETGYEFEAHINKYDGRPFTLEEVLRELDGHISRL